MQPEDDRNMNKGRSGTLRLERKGYRDAQHDEKTVFDL